MDFPHPLGEHLSVLTDAIDDPGIDLDATLASLTAGLTAVVPSFLGLIVTLDLDGCPVTVTAIDPDLAKGAGASLLLPLDPLAGAGPGSAVVLYAGTPGAFVDLAADTRDAYHLNGQIVLDGHLPPRAGPVQGVGGFEEIQLTNQAIGALIEMGNPPDEAHNELQRRAAHHRRGLPGAAEYLLTATPHTDLSAAADC